MNGSCPLCRFPETVHYGQGGGRLFVCCCRCKLVFAPPHFHPTPAVERERYALHDNTAQNKGYVRYLQGVARVVERTLPPPAHVLDCGCGEHRVLETILAKRGFIVDGYDPLYGYTPANPAKFNGVVLCEVVEHFRAVWQEFTRVDQWCAPGAMIYIKTQPVVDPEMFSRWWYVADPTHLSLYAPETLAWIAEHYGWRPVERVDRDFFIFRKSGAKRDFAAP